MNDFYSIHELERRNSDDWDIDDALAPGNRAPSPAGIQLEKVNTLLMQGIVDHNTEYLSTSNVGVVPDFEIYNDGFSVQATYEQHELIVSYLDLLSEYLRPENALPPYAQIRIQSKSMHE